MEIEENLKTIIDFSKQQKATILIKNAVEPIEDKEICVLTVRTLLFMTKEETNRTLKSIVNTHSGNTLVIADDFLCSSPEIQSEILKFIYTDKHDNIHFLLTETNTTKVNIPQWVLNDMNIRTFNLKN